LRRLTGDGTGVIDDDVDAFGPVVIVKGAARDLRVVNLGLDAVEVLHDLEVEVRKILRAPKADLGVEGAVRLDRHLCQLLPAK